MTNNKKERCLIVDTYDKARPKRRAYRDFEEPAEVSYYYTREVGS